MNRRIVTRVVRPTDAVPDMLINRDATEVWWISVSVETLNAMGLIQIYDGFDAGGKLVWELTPGYARNYNFIPPIPCEQGVFVHTNTIDQHKIFSYTIAYRAKKWDRPPTAPEDVIIPPEAKE